MTTATTPTPGVRLAIEHLYALAIPPHGEASAAPAPRGSQQIGGRP